MKALFVSRKDIVSKTPIGGTVDPDKLMQYIEIAQDLSIEPQLGTDLYNKLQNDIINDTLAGDYKDLLVNYIKPMLIHFAAAEFLAYASYNVSNGGIFRHSPENGQAVNREDVDYIVEKQRKTAKVYEDRFNDYMCSHAATKFPEFYTNSDSDISPSRRTNYTNWVL